MSSWESTGSELPLRALRIRSMATKRWVVNASALILPGKRANLALLVGLADSVVVPQSLADEIGEQVPPSNIRHCSCGGS